jgi:aspartate/methionine/tyrosine aminotransferase
MACWAALDLCAKYGVWAISDEAYKHSVFDG